MAKVKASQVIALAKSWVGYSEANGKHKKIVDIYNSHSPLARGYKLKYTDAWCDGGLSAMFIALGAEDMIGTEVGVERHVEIFKKLGIWIEDGTIVPEEGDVIVFNFDQMTQPNDGWAGHIGLVTDIYNNKSRMDAVECNYAGEVAITTYPVGYGAIRGFARPRYLAETTQPAKPVSNHIGVVEYMTINGNKRYLNVYPSDTLTKASGHGRYNQLLTIGTAGARNCFEYCKNGKAGGKSYDTKPKGTVLHVKNVKDLPTK